MEPMEKSNEFTFRQLFRLVKKSMFRIFIFCLIASFVMGIVLVSVFFSPASRNESVSVIINYSYRGAERGRNPLGGVLDVSRVKSPEVILAAIRELGIDEKYQTAIIINDDKNLNSSYIN